MKITIYILTLFILTSCENHQQKDISTSVKTDTTTIATTVVDKPQIQYTDRQLEKFLDSVGGLTTQPLADKVSFIADSTFKNQVQVDKSISDADFLKLKNVIDENKENDRVLDINTVKRIFGEIKVDSSFLADGQIPITFYSFDKRTSDFNEYAICLGYPMDWSCELYFFKSNKIISKHTVFHRYGLELEHYKDSDGKTIVYYKENFGSGSGIWQFNFYFYKYYDGKLIPILNELENGNLQGGWGARIYWLKAVVIKNNPLTMKMVYYQELSDTSGLRYRIIDESTVVQYSWDEKSKTLIGNYEKASINKQQMLTYFLADNELLFINAYYKTLKACLDDKTKRQLTLDYLNRMKNHFDNN